MRTVALLQAGGRGVRMQRSAGATFKPLVRVRGVPLLERGLLALLRAGFRDVAVAVPADAAPLAEFVDGRCRDLARAFAARVDKLVEAAPRGTIGIVAELAGRADVALVVNSDNLTTLDLAVMAQAHVESGAAMTIAVHKEPFTVPYGVVELDGERVVAYREKPTHEADVCSAVSLLDAATLALVPRDAPCHLPDVVRSVLRSGRIVRAHRHAAPWVDVNAAGDVARAESLLARHAEFDQLTDAPAREVAGALVRCGDALLLERRAPKAEWHAGLWDTPGGKLEAGEAASAAIARELAEELGLERTAPSPVATFDDVDVSRAAIVRHHVFQLEVERDAVTPRQGEFRWVPLAQVDQLAPLNGVVIRSLAAARPLTESTATADLAR